MTQTASGWLRWAVKESLIAYMVADPTFSVTTTGGGTFSEEAGVVLPVVVDSSGVVRATGSVTLRAHSGALAIPLNQVTIEDSSLWIDDPIDDAPEQGRLRLVDLTGPDAADDPSVKTFITRLSGDADVLFSYRYAPGTAFAGLVLHLPGVGDGVG